MYPVDNIPASTTDYSKYYVEDPTPMGLSSGLGASAQSHTSLLDQLGAQYYSDNVPTTPCAAYVVYIYGISSITDRFKPIRNIALQPFDVQAMIDACERQKALIGFEFDADLNTNGDISDVDEGVSSPLSHTTTTTTITTT